MAELYFPAEIFPYQFQVWPERIALPGKPVSQTSFCSTQLHQDPRHKYVKFFRIPCIARYLVNPVCDIL